MNEKRIREVIEVEQRAMEMVAQANRDAEQIPIRARTEAAAIIEKARAAAQAEAQRIVEQAQQGDEAAGILSRAQDEISRTSQLAAKNLETAVAYVIERVLGKG